MALFGFKAIPAICEVSVCSDQMLTIKIKPANNNFQPNLNPDGSATADLAGSKVLVDDRHQQSGFAEFRARRKNIR